MTIDHMSLPVSDLARARHFYDRVLATLGYKRLHDVDVPEYCGSGYGSDASGLPEPAFWIGTGNPPAAVTPREGVHVGFAAPDRTAVDAFYQMALTVGGKDNGRPGLRPHYHEHYYGAFVIDLDGHHIEACCHHPAAG